MAEKRLIKAGATGFEQFGATDTIPGINYPEPSVISPSQITSDQDNYNPTGWADADIVRLNFDTGGRGITGLTAWTNTRQKRVVNTSGNFGYLPCQHPDSTAANRIIGICDHIIAPYGTLIVEYDDTSDRVRVVGNSFNPAAPGIGNLRGHYYRASPGATLGSDWGLIGFGISGGNNGTIAGTSTLPGGWEINTSSSASGASSIYFTKGVITATNLTFFGSAHIISSVIVYFSTLSVAAQTYTFSHGLIPNAGLLTLNVNNSVTIQYTHGTNSGKFLGVCRDNSGSQGTVDLGITVAANTAYVLTICHDKANGESRFYVDGVMSGRVTSNMPNGVAVGDRTIIVKSAGTTARNAVVSVKSLSTVY